MQALLQKEREAERRRREQQLRAEAEQTWQQQRLAGAYADAYTSTLRAQRAEGTAHGRHSTQARPADSGGSCDTWRAAVRGNGLQGGVEEWGEAAEGWWDGEEQEEQEEEEEEGQGQQEQQQQEQQEQPQHAYGHQRQRQRRRGRRGRKRRRQEAEEEEQGEDGACEASGYMQSYEDDLDRIVRAVPHQWVNSSLEADLWKGKTLELQPLTTHVRRQLGERCGAYLAAVARPSLSRRRVSVSCCLRWLPAHSVLPAECVFGGHWLAAEVGGMSNLSACLLAARPVAATACWMGPPRSRAMAVLFTLL